MHEIRVDKYAVNVNDWQTGVILFFCISGLGALAAGLMVVIDIIRWSYWS